jgi:hypothetical protein
LFSKFDDRVCRYIFFWLYDITSVAGNLFRQIINERYNINLINDPKKDALATVDSNIAVNNRVSSKKKFMLIPLVVQYYVLMTKHIILYSSKQGLVINQDPTSKNNIFTNNQLVSGGVASSTPAEPSTESNTIKHSHNKKISIK